MTIVRPSSSKRQSFRTPGGMSEAAGRRLLLAEARGGGLKRAARTPPGLYKGARLSSPVGTEKRKALSQTVCRREKKEEGKENREEKRERRERREERRKKREYDTEINDKTDPKRFQNSSKVR